MTRPGAGLDVDSLGTALWLLVAEAGHLGCDGWTFEERAGLLECACGTPLYEFREVDGRGVGPAGSAPRAAGRDGADETG
jgi:hypothetical protein